MRLEFGEFTLDRGPRGLFRGQTPLHLEPKALELLGLLLERRPQAVAKTEIRDSLRPETFVSDSSLTSLVAQIRETWRRRRVRCLPLAYPGGKRLRTLSQ